MRIGILTLPLHTNYGGILQAYALQTVLERMGHSVSLLDGPNWEPSKLPLYKIPLVYAKRFVLRYVLGKSDAPIRFEQYVAKQEKDFEKNTRRFIDKYLHAVPERNYYDLQEKDFDAIVVGSDQVWRPMYFPHRDGMSIQDAYLAFAEKWNIRRIAYAASFGTDEWEYTARETRRCGYLLKLFDVVSVRENKAVAIVKKRFGVEAVHLLDPTMLLQCDDYSRLISEAERVGTLDHNGNVPPFILSYVLDETKEIQKILENVAQSEDLEIKRSKSKPLKFASFSTKDLDEHIQPPVESWLQNFNCCKYVVTDSFHACVFSILNHKQFIVIGNKKRGLSRFESLLKMFGLEDRMVSEKTDFYQTLLRPIDYDSVDEKLNKLRKISYEFLEKNLRNGKE